MMIDVSGMFAALKLIQQTAYRVLVNTLGSIRAAVGIMGPEPAIFEFPQAAVGWQRFRFENVESGSGNSFLLKSPDQGRFFNNRPTGSVDEKCRWFHPFESRIVEKMK